MTYNPNPEDTSNIKLSDDIVAVFEQISKNTHEVWAKGRIDEGWIHGDIYDGIRKMHPRLVPYEQLPEDEKAFDRNTTAQVIKMLIKLGFIVIRTD